MITKDVSTESHFIDINGIKAYYLKAGRGDPVLFLPGLAASVGMSTESTIKPLAGRFTVYALDLPGSGESDKPPLDYTLAQGIQYVVDFLDAHDLDNINVVGLSRGGLISLTLALEHPDRVKKLVLVNSAGLGPEISLGFRLMSLPILGELLAAPSLFIVRAILRRTYRYCPSVDVDFLAREFHRLMHLPGAKSALLRTIRHGICINGLKPNVVMRDRLSEVKAPTLIVWGAADNVIPVAHAYAAHSLIDGSQLHVFDNCGHDPAQERSEEFVELVANFLDGIYNRGNGI